MATSPTTKSAPLSGAAKDDAVGLDGDFTFTIADLLGNDPGGAAKVNVLTQFFFGTTQADRDDQATYLSQHKITLNLDGSFTIGDGATDFQYSVQIGNKGTWSQANVDVTAPVPHAGPALFTENFDGYDGIKFETPNDFWQLTNLHDAHGWDGATAAGSELGSNGYSNIATTSGVGEQAFWLDTQNSIGPIDLSHTFVDSTAAASDGVTAVLSFTIAKQNLGDIGHTADNATFQFKIDDTIVKTISAADLATYNAMTPFTVALAEYADLTDSTHTLSLVDTTTGSYIGFAVDSIQINDWVI